MADKMLSDLCKGTWSSVTACTIGDIVDNNGSSYVCVANSTGNEPPNASYWALIASKGSTSSVIVGMDGAVDYVCDGIADDVQLQAAADAINALGGGKIFIKEGTYNFTTAVKIYSNTLVMGSGFSTILKMTAGANLSNMIYAETSGHDIIFKDFQVDGNGDNQTGPNIATLVGSTLGTRIYAHHIYTHDSVRTGIYWGGATDCVIDSCIADTNGRLVLASTQGVGFGLNEAISGGVTTLTTGCKIINCHATGNAEAGYSLFGLDEVSGPQNCIISNNTATDNTTTGISIFGANHCLITNNTTHGSPVAIQLSASSHNVVSNNIFKDVSGTGYGVYLTTFSGAYSQYNEIIGNEIYSPSQIGISIPAGCTFNNVIGNTVTLATRQGILVQSNNNTVSNNLVFNNNREGIYLGAASYCKVTGNTVYNNSQAAVNTYDGIYIYNTSTHNIISNNQIDGQSDQKYGIREASAVDDYNIISGNTCVNNATAQILIQGANSEIGHNTEA